MLYRQTAGEQIYFPLRWIAIVIKPGMGRNPGVHYLI